MSNRVIFINSDVSNYQTLISQLPAGFEVVLLDAEQDGVMQIATALQGKMNLDAIDIISHGVSGTLTLGSGILNSNNLADYAVQLSEIGKHLSDDGDILLYGCDVAQGKTGRSFVDQLARLTGADVAASDDLTGNTALGGNWVLEQNVGQVETVAIESGIYTILPMTGTGLANIPQSLTSDASNWLHQVGAYFTTLAYGDTNLGAGLPSDTSTSLWNGNFDSGFDDNYSAFINSNTLLDNQWQLLGSQQLSLSNPQGTFAEFTPGGLFESYVSTIDHVDQYHISNGITYGNSNAIVVRNHKIL